LGAWDALHRFKMASTMMRPISPYQNELQDEEGFDIKCQKE